MTFYISPYTAAHQHNAVEKKNYHM